MDACVQLTSVLIVLQNQTESWTVKSLEWEIKTSQDRQSANLRDFMEKGDEEKKT